MHEIHFLEDLFKDIIGHLNQHNAKNVRFFFKEKSKGLPLENALFNIKRIPQQRVLRLVSFDCD
jgi:Zn finger protein HypA/HybF involved in hydrogenase expression